MSLTTSEMTPADIAAVTCNNGSNGAWGGDGFWWMFILFLFAFCGWGNNGWGGNNSGGLGSPYGQGWATRADINEGFALQGLQTGQIGRAHV